MTKEIVHIAYDIPSPEGVTQDNSATITSIHVGEPWESILIFVKEAQMMPSGAISGQVQSVRLHKDRAIAAARAILKHFGEGLE